MSDKYKSGSIPAFCDPSKRLLGISTDVLRASTLPVGVSGADQAQFFACRAYASHSVVGKTCTAMIAFHIVTGLAISRLVAVLDVVLAVAVGDAALFRHGRLIW